MGRYKIYDAETENHRSRKRTANPFDERNWVVYRGWKNQGDTSCSWSHHPVKGDGLWLEIEDDITLLVGFNFKFDMLYEWASPALKAFFKRGGRVWDAQYVEYLLNAQHPDYQMCSLDSIVEKYGGRKKIDEVKILWNAGMLTSEIDPNLMIDYLVGTEEEQRNSGDIGNTELIFLGQYKEAKRLGMLPMIMARMDGLCATTEMEYNGLHIDVQEAKRRAQELEKQLADCVALLEQYIPELPEGLEFNWGSPTHRSCLIFGGTIKYERQAPYLDEATGELARKKATAEWPLVDGIPVDPVQFEAEQLHQDRFTSGKKKGEPRFKKVDVPGEIKVKYQDFLFELPGYVKPDPRWALKMLDGAENLIYSTDDDTIQALKTKKIPFLELMGQRQDCYKDLGTYYIQYDPKKKEYVGMLTCVDPQTHIVHHSLNHTSTITTRLSSSNPNMQNIPTEGTSEVKKMFTSRIALTGIIMELDYSQLEVVVQGVLSGDIQLCKDLRDKVDFHCKRVAAKYGCTYEEALFRCKDESYENYHTWKNYRRGCKEFSFQRAYGAGAAAIADKTGLAVDDVKTLIEIEDRMYPGVAKFNALVESAVKTSAEPFKQFFEGGGYKVYRRGHWTSPTGTRYGFRTYDAMDWQKEKGIQDSFMPTEIKNYPTQGTAGEIVQIMVGKVWRHFVSNDNYDGQALLCNTVHDSLWIDLQEALAEQVGREVKAIMESVPATLKQLYNMDVTVPFPVDVEVGKNLYVKKHLAV